MIVPNISEVMFRVAMFAHKIDVAAGTDNSRITAR